MCSATRPGLRSAPTREDSSYVGAFRLTKTQLASCTSMKKGANRLPSE
ncbi:hypothetical protein VIBNIWn13_360130 [Vibrio nigripulchritudo Wn13]|nr:hypothetical protein VIBNIENn2_1070033 [Vibrio nigripulchritudo ENn2]CCO40321.1 hypothetical protein VIBNISFn135_360033 [Vibrio nigripulchritudo SFn135]CCO52695.1 hypothetical protein VIBNIWn13_360130 [Vibrio nigripulchritudo Wn13]